MGNEVTTAQDQQSRAEFEAWYIAQARRIVPDLKDWSDDEVREGVMSPRKNGSYSVGGAQTAWETWQAARALPDGVEPAASVYTMEALVPGGREVAHVSLRQPLPGGTKLYTAAQVQAMLAQAVASRKEAQQQLEDCKAELAKLEAYRFAMNRGHLLPPGWQAVPVKPTAEMMQSVYAALESEGIHTTTWLRRTAFDTFLAASPRPPAAQEQA